MWKKKQKQSLSFEVGIGYTHDGNPLWLWK